jgi:hypothetical protein
LLVDSDAPEALEIARKRFQVVAGRDSQIGQNIGGVELPKTQKRALLNLSRQFFGTAPIPDLFAFLACERLNHSTSLPFQGTAAAGKFKVVVKSL